MNQILMRLLQMMHLKSRSRSLKPITLPNSQKMELRAMGREMEERN